MRSKMAERIRTLPERKSIQYLADISLVTRAGFLTSQIMRDFTLKSAASFGLFQLLKTWIDYWIAISVLRPSVLSSESATSSPTGISVIIPRQPLQLSEDDLPTAVPPPFHHLGHRPSSSTSSIQYDAQGHPSFIQRSNQFMPDLTMANLSMSGSTGFSMM